MATTLRVFSRALTVAATLGLSFGACAQSSFTDFQGNVMTKPGHSFIDIAIGKPQYSTSCGNVPGFTCSNNGTSYSITAGNMITRNIGAELSYLDFGSAERAGGSVSARGVNLSAVGRLPLGDSVALEGKLGATYGVTRVNAAVSSGLSSGRDSGVGLGFGLGLDIHMARNLVGNVGWEQHDFHFAGQGVSNVRNVTVGLGLEF